MRIRARHPGLTWRGRAIGVLTVGWVFVAILAVDGLTSLVGMSREDQPGWLRLVTVVTAVVPVIAFLVAVTLRRPARRMGWIRSILEEAVLDADGIDLVEADGRVRRFEWVDVVALELRGGAWLLVDTDDRSMIEIPRELMPLAEKIVAVRSGRYALRDQSRATLWPGLGIRRPDEPIEPFRPAGNPRVLIAGIGLSVVAFTLLVWMLAERS